MSIADTEAVTTPAAVQRATCGGCDSPNLEPVLNLGSTPLADTFPADPAATEVTYPLRVAACRRCGLVQLLDVVPDRLLYGESYGFTSSASPSLRAYHRTYARQLLARYGDQAKQLTVEVACNDGDLLQHFAAAGCRTVGIDPAPAQTQAARERGLAAITAPFDTTAAAQIRAAHGPAGLIVANNVLAHVPDLHEVMQGIADLLAPRGTAVIQVQYLPDLLVGNQWDHVYHEHRYYFGVGPLALLAMKHGLSVRHVAHSAAQGGSVQVTLVRGVGYGDQGVPSLERAARAEEWLAVPAAYSGVQGRVDYCRDRILDALLAEAKQDRSVAGYAASAKSCTLLNYCAVTAGQVPHVVDTTPYKIGRFTPGTHLPIVGPGDRPDPDTYLLLAWNYLPGILRREAAFAAAGGRFLVPTPLPVLL
jgi:SAM-dependent methyltransferase